MRSPKGLVFPEGRGQKKLTCNEETLNGFLAAAGYRSSHFGTTVPAGAGELKRLLIKNPFG